jgi:glycosyltransferase involved in cell wall biosynthesis
MQSARAFLYAAEEDFGISMVEAQACGTPLIAFGHGGSRDILKTSDGGPVTGFLFDQQTPESLRAAVVRFEAQSPTISADDCRRNAMRFSEPVFLARMRLVVADAMAARPGVTHEVDAATIHAAPVDLLLEHSFAD